MRKTALLIGALALFYAVFARVALHGFPFSGDEYSALFQGEIFARGLLRVPAPQHPELFGVDHVVLDQWMRTKYPPGSSALLALGVIAGVPWLVNPLEGAITLLLFWWAARPFLGERNARVAVLLVGAAPLFAFQSSSFYSLTPTTMWLAAGFAAMSAWSRDERALWPWLAGVAIGCAFLTRPLDAVLFGVALLALRSVRVLVWAVLGAAPFVILLLVYQKLQFGSPLTDGYRAYEPAFRAIYGHETGPSVSLENLLSPEQLWHHLDIVRAFLVDWTVVGTGLFAVVGWFALRDDSRAAAMRRFVVVWIGVVLLSLLPTLADYDDGARPRYLSAALLPVAWLAGAGWHVAGAKLAEVVGARTARVVGTIVAIIAPLQLGAFLVIRTPALWTREGVFDLVAKRGIQGGLVVVRAKYPTRYARNGPFFDGPVLYLSPPASLSAGEVADLFPGRPVYEAHEGDALLSIPWTIDRVR